LGRFLQQTILNSELVVMPEAGHAPHWEQPDAFNKALIAFIEAQAAQ
jgi:pimeloyl-ACP methyl ester carboxylesterase